MYSMSTDQCDGMNACIAICFRPKRAVNTYGKWKVLVNLPDEYYAKGNSSYLL
jgi:hypothetical protein